MMNALSQEPWRRIDALYAAALEQPPEARDAFLREAAATDAELEREVRALLESDAAAEQALKRPAAELASLLASFPAESDLETAAALPAGDRVGPYRIVEEIARGGMGAVYLAERADEQFEKRVALKLVKRGMDSDEILRRFRYERQILASLEHPNIALLLDGGMSEEGQPYLVMEYIPGQPIDRYCDEHGLSVEARLALFEAVCGAVQYAHQTLVVHRDLKPSNILVTEEGQVKLLDFGIAKLLSEDEHTAPRTGTGMRVLTPDYASPEQISGAPITVASDVYSLGVVLYRLLTGRPPHRRSGQRSYDVERATLEQEAERPSAALARQPPPDTGGDRPEPSALAIAAARGATVESLRRRLRGDLDSIVLKSLEKDPAQRYGSVEQLRVDLMRHRAGLPVGAHSASLRYRTGKFVRRHRGAMTAAGFFVMLLIGSAVAMALQQQVTARERDLARRERDRSERVVSFMSEMLGSANPAEARGTVPTVFDLLSRSEARLDTALAQQPDVQATLWHVIGHVYGSLGEYQRAVPALERALSLRRELFGGRSLVVAETADELANVVEAQGEYAASEPLRQLSLEIRTAIGEQRPEVATALHNLGYLFFRKGEYPKAEHYYARSAELARRFEGDPLVLANALNGWGMALANRGSWTEAEPLLREALSLRRSALGDDHPLIPSTLVNLASLLRDRGEIDAAEQHFREAIETRRRILPEDHPDLALAVVGLAYLLHKKKDLAGAEEMFRWSLDINQRKYGSQHPEVGLGMNALAGVLSERGQQREAEQMLRGSLDVLRQSLGERHPRVSMPLFSLGALLRENGRAREAEPLLREALALRGAGLGDTHFATLAARYELAECLLALRRFADAESLLLESQQRLAQVPEEPEQLEDVRARLAKLYTAWGRPAKADAKRTP